MSVNYDLSVLYFLTEAYDKAVHHARLLSSSSNEEQIKAAILLETISLNGLRKWTEAREVLLKYPDLAETQIKQIEEWYKKPPKMKKHKVAYVLGFIPGMGIAYAGKPMVGLLNFSINAVFLSFGVYEFINSYYITGYFVGAIGINKFYFGGRAHAKWLIDKRNVEFTDKFNNELKGKVLMIE
jgi:hypothetical protein